MPGGSILRFLALAAFIVAVAIGLWLADVDGPLVVLGVFLAWAIASLFEWLTWREAEQGWTTYERRVGVPARAAPPHARPRRQPGAIVARAASLLRPSASAGPPAPGSPEPLVEESPARERRAYTPVLTFEPTPVVQAEVEREAPSGASPEAGDEPEPEPEPAPEPDSEPAPEPKPEPEPEPRPEPGPAQPRETEPPFQQEREPAPEPEPVVGAVEADVTTRAESASAGGADPVPPAEPRPSWVRTFLRRPRAAETTGPPAVEAASGIESRQEPGPAAPAPTVPAAVEPPAAPPRAPEPPVAPARRSPEPRRAPPPEVERPRPRPVPSPPVRPVVRSPAPPQRRDVPRLSERRRDPQQWNLWELERLARAEARQAPAATEGWSYLFLHLRQFADAQGTLPVEFDGLVRESFGGLLDRLETR